MALVADIAPPAKLGRYLGYAGLVYALTFVARAADGRSLRRPPVVALGVLHQPARPACSAAAFVLALVPTARSTRRRTIDFAGIGAPRRDDDDVVLLTSWGGVEYDWDSPVMLFLVAAAIVAALGFVAWERRAPDPLHPARGRAGPDDRTRDAHATSSPGMRLHDARSCSSRCCSKPSPGRARPNRACCLIPLGLANRAHDRRRRSHRRTVGGAKAVPALGMMLAIGRVRAPRHDRRRHDRGFAADRGRVPRGRRRLCDADDAASSCSGRCRSSTSASTTSTVMLGRSSASALGVALFGAIFNNHLDDSLDRVSPSLDLASFRGDPETIAALEPALRRDRVGGVRRRARGRVSACSSS